MVRWFKRLIVRRLEMNQSRYRAMKVYGGSGAVLLVSFIAAWLLPVAELFKGFAAVPGVGALLNVLFQLWKDERAHERAVELLHRQQDFALATASHMANVAYDKHVMFCEAYVERADEPRPRRADGLRAIEGGAESSRRPAQNPDRSCHLAHGRD